MKYFIKIFIVSFMLIMLMVSTSNASLRWNDLDKQASGFIATGEAER